MSFNLETVVVLNDVPEEWVYKYYLSIGFDIEINQPFDGRTIIIRSIYNRDTTPSLCFYYNNTTKEYLWHDKSAGKGGDKADFYKYVHNKSRSVAIENICKDYSDYCQSGETVIGLSKTKIKETSKTEYYFTKKPDFTSIDLARWGEFKICQETLRKYNVSSIYNYQTTKWITEEVDGISIRRERKGMFPGDQRYVFYRKAGQMGLKPYQLYQPGLTPKYININPENYLIGYDQASRMHDTCVIVSGLKDVMALSEVKLDIDIVANISEVGILEGKWYEELKQYYKYLITIMDNDPTGLACMIRHKKVYDIPYIHLGDMKKDIALNNKHYSIEELRNRYTLYINRIINA